MINTNRHFFRKMKCKSKNVIINVKNTLITNNYVVFMIVKKNIVLYNKVEKSLRALHNSEKHKKNLFSFGYIHYIY